MKERITSTRWAVYQLWLKHDKKIKPTSAQLRRDFRKYWTPEKVRQVVANVQRKLREGVEPPTEE